MINLSWERSKSISLVAARAAVFCGSLVLTNVAQANLILNGDFEAGATDWMFFGNVGVVAPAGAPLWFGGGNAADNGTRVVAFNAFDRPPSGWLSQTFNTVIGVTYNVQYDYGVTGVRPPDVQSIDASILGNDGSTVLASQTANGANPPSALNTFSFSFVADGLQSTIRFADVDTNLTFSRDGILDNVSVSVTAIPEPEIYAMLGVGLGLLGWVGRRKKLKIRAAV